MDIHQGLALLVQEILIQLEEHQHVYNVQLLTVPLVLQMDLNVKHVQ